MIQVKNVSKSFTVYKKDSGFKGAVKGLFKRQKEEIKAVKDISFQINKGEIIGYIGANGAGKSTTIKMMTGVLTPSSGQILVGGVVPHENRIENAKHIGVVFGQRTQLWWDLPLEETYTILKEIYNVPDQVFKERYDYLTDLLEIEPFIKQPVRTLSLGQRMRADLAASMLHNPDILYLDEPTIGLDVMVKERIRKAIKSMNQKYNVTVILTTHDMSDIQELATRIMIIDKGEIIYDGSKEAINKQFGNTRQLSLKIDGLSDQHVEVMTQFMADYESRVAIEEGALKITFNQDQIAVADILSYVMENYRVLDFSLQDQNIEEIVKKLYTGGVS
ncbi:ATP-binding cassette domain-containing protein [Acidaminobacter sp. JC074]|uniref:ABC transporter ATP-binding protein n=1 Tax=Acidaminobacter sp. JC074 TaxID=2530199 RepID=UPI001F106327|nr:ATP-binding cassette domain-containing protein [Acidaminobacter sp. JC074]MCH4888213.1 ATP-binding cassette domain-containing protein [Acidaminobacter sp. JC074]